MVIRSCGFLGGHGARVEFWKMSQPEGLAGIENFNHLVAGTALAYLATKHVLAKPPQHQFDIVAALLAGMQANEGYVPAKRLQEWLAAHPPLGEVIELMWEDSDVEASEVIELQVLGEDAVRALLQQLLQKVVQDRANRNNDDSYDMTEPIGSTQPSEPNAPVVDVAKWLLQTQR